MAPYKLSAEIQEFIINRKKADPQLSCRILAPLIARQFNVPISKSSINAIFKANGLSKPVGRTRIRGKVVLAQSNVAGTLRDLPRISREKEPVRETTVVLENLPAEPAPVVPVPEKVPVEPVPVIPAVAEAPAELPAEPPAEPPTEPPVESVVIAPESVINVQLSQTAEYKPVVPAPEFMNIRTDHVFVSNGGCFFLLAADSKSGISVLIAEKISRKLPHLSRDFVHTIILAELFKPIFRNIDDFWVFLGREIKEPVYSHYLGEIQALSFEELIPELEHLDFERKLISFKELFRESLLKIHNYFQSQFLPGGYRAFDLLTMFSKFYALRGRVEKNSNLLIIHLIYDAQFRWIQDIVWLEDFSYAVNKINEAIVKTADDEQIWIDPNPKPLP